VHDAVAVCQAGLDHHLHAFEEFVVGGGEQGAVEGEVGLDGVGGAAALLPHRVEGAVQGGQVRVGAALGGQAYGGGFDDGAHFGEVVQQRPVGLAGGGALELPAQYVGVEQVPLGAGAHEGAAPLPGVDHPLGREHLQRLAQRGQAHVQLALQRHEIQRGPFGDLTAQDAAGEEFHGLAVYASTGIGRHVVQPFCWLGSVVMRRP
jgi:hypothetical protein